MKFKFNNASTSTDKIGRPTRSVVYCYSRNIGGSELDFEKDVLPFANKRLENFMAALKADHMMASGTIKDTSSNPNYDDASFEIKVTLNSRKADFRDCRNFMNLINPK